MNKIKEQVEELEKEIEYEQNQYDVACKYPTETNQFYRALGKQGTKLEEKKRRLQKLKSNLTNTTNKEESNE